MASTSKNTAQKSARGRAKPAHARRTRRANPARSTKLDLMATLLTRPKGASLADLTTATGWQPHSVRGALAGSLKKKGHAVVSDKSGGERRYRIDPR